METTTLKLTLEEGRALDIEGAPEGIAEQALKERIAQCMQGPERVREALRGDDAGHITWERLQCALFAGETDAASRTRARKGWWGAVGEGDWERAQTLIATQWASQRTSGHWTMEGEDEQRRPIEVEGIPGALRGRESTNVVETACAKTLKTLSGRREPGTALQWETCALCERLSDATTALGMDMSSTREPAALAARHALAGDHHDAAQRSIKALEVRAHTRQAEREAQSQPINLPERLHIGQMKREYERESGTAWDDEDGRVELLQWWLERNRPELFQEFRITHDGAIVHGASFSDCGRYRSEGDTMVAGTITLRDFEPGPGEHDRAIDGAKLLAPRRFANDDNGCKPLGDLAARQEMHYVEGWPIMDLNAALGQGDETVTPKAVAVGPHGIYIVRAGAHDEQPATRAGERTNEMRNDRIRDWIAQRLGYTETEVPVHILTTGTDQLWGGSPKNVRAEKIDDYWTAHWHARVRDEHPRCHATTLANTWERLLPGQSDIGYTTTLGEKERILREALNASSREPMLTRIAKAARNNKHTDDPSRRASAMRTTNRAPER